MNTLPEIETAIKQLPEEDVRQLSEWLQEYLNEMWDLQLVNDVKSGKLDSLIAKAERDIKANKVRQLDEVLDNT